MIELEKRFWSLVGNSPSGRIDISIITPLVTPPLPPDLVPGLFRAFDENQVKIWIKSKLQLNIKSYKLKNAIECTRR